MGLTILDRLALDLAEQILGKGVKICSRCRRAKSFAEFYPHRSNCSDPTKVSAYLSRCKACHLELSREGYARQKSIEPERARRRARANQVGRYGLSLDEYDQMVEDQRGLCAICGCPPRWRNSSGQLLLSVDHCHRTGKVRGLLCSKCNQALGLLDDCVEWFENANRYLAAHPETTAEARRAEILSRIVLYERVMGEPCPH